MRLYESALYHEETWKEIELLIDSGELTDEQLESFDKTLNELEGERDHKALSIACVIKGCKAESNALKHEKQRIDAKIRSNTKTVDYLKHYLVQFLPHDEKIKDARAAISWRKSEKVILDVQVEELPDRFLKVERTPILGLIGQELAESENPDRFSYAHIETNQNIQIK